MKRLTVYMAVAFVLAAGGAVNVRDFGAKGDGVADERLWRSSKRRTPETPPSEKRHSCRFFKM